VSALGAAAPPLFLYLCYTDPHAGGWTSDDVELGNPVPSDGGFTDASWPVPERDHASVIVNYQDIDVGRVVAAANAVGGPDAWVKVFASDNGASNEGDHNYLFFDSSGPLRGFKRCLTEGGIRTPLSITWEGTIASGVVSNYTAAFWDLGPTILDLAGVPQADWPQDIDGVSFKDVLLSGGGNSDSKMLYWEFCTGTHPPLEPRSGVGWGHAVRMGKWKAVSFFEDQALRLYDLTTDIYEVHDVSADYPDVVKQIEAFAAAAHVDSAVFPIKNCTPS